MFRPALLAEAAAGNWLEPAVQRRAEHVVAENGRVLETVEAFGAGDLAAVGRLFAASHASLRDLFEVSSARSGRDGRGCPGARPA